MPVRNCIALVWPCILFSCILVLLISPSSCISLGINLSAWLTPIVFAEETLLTTPLRTFTYGPGNHVITIKHQNYTRQYRVYVPKAYRPEHQPKHHWPVVIQLHGGGVTADHAMRSTKTMAKANTAHFIAVFPEGLGKTALGKTFGTWNAGRCCGYAKEQSIDDVGFIRLVIQDLQTKFSVDAKRIFVAGHSNGALMSYRLACELSDVIAAIAPNAAQDALDTCKPKRPVPILHFHGTADPAAPYSGGKCGGRLGDAGWTCQAVPTYINSWKEKYHCQGVERVFYEKGAAKCITYDACDQNSEVALCTIVGGGHTWPGGEYGARRRSAKRAVGPISRDISADDLMWEFFKRHPLP